MSVCVCETTSIEGERRGCYARGRGYAKLKRFSFLDSVAFKDVFNFGVAKTVLLYHYKFNLIFVYARSESAQNIHSQYVRCVSNHLFSLFTSYVRWNANY